MPEKKKSCIMGMDLGNETTVLATMEKAGHVQVIPDPDGLDATPTAIAFEGGDPESPLFGRAARSYRKMHPEWVCGYAKGLRGNENSTGIVDKDGRPWTGAELETRFALWRLKHAGEFLGEPIAGVLATVPAVFDNAQREATRKIIGDTGYPCIGTVNEPTAAILGYAKERLGIYAVADIGGGTSDFTIMRVEEKGIYETLATSGKDDLGGREFTACLFGHAHEFAKTQGVELDPQVDFRDMVGIEQACEQAKIELTVQKSSFISFLARGKLMELEVTRETFEEVTKHLGDLILSHMKEALAKAKLEPGSIDGAVFAGGGSRVPCARRGIEELFGESKILRDIDVDKAVAIGACSAIGLKLEERRQSGDTKLVKSVHAYYLGGGVSLREIAGQALGVEALNKGTGEQVLAPIVEQGTPLPVSASKCYGLLNSSSGQVTAAIKVLEGPARRPASEGRLLAEFPMEDLPAGPEEDRIEVFFDVNTDGLVDVRAVDKISGKEITKKVDAASAVSKENIG